jgi:tRNA pseudouridine38-40 synthase
MPVRYFIEIAYNGTNYHGWQIQDGETTVQQLLEQGLKYKLGLDDRVTGCGRTDTGVHARQFFAHFDLDKDLSADELENGAYELNSFLPQDIVVFRIFRVNDEAHARFDALSRTYRYYLNTEKDPFAADLSWSYRVNLDVDKMNEAASVLMDYSDFTSFSKLHTDVKTNNCKISEAFWISKSGRLTFTITADRYLRNMVRAIVGTLVEVGREKLSPDGFRKIIEAKDRGRAGMSAPAKGLFLEKVEYDLEKVLIK